MSNSRGVSRRGGINIKNEILEITKIKKLKTRTIEVKCKVVKTKAEDLDEYVDKKTINACAKGCPNYQRKWSCPPYSKSYEEIRRNYKNAIIICFSTDMNKYEDIKNKYLAMKAANVTLKTSIEKTARSIEELLEGYALLSGSCRLCKPCNCKLNLPCKRPLKMRYSMEATHLDVNKLSKDKLNHPLLWYQDKQLPLYTTTVSLVLTNKEFKLDGLIKFIDEIFT